MPEEFQDDYKDNIAQPIIDAEQNQKDEDYDAHSD